MTATAFPEPLFDAPDEIGATDPLADVASSAVAGPRRPGSRPSWSRPAFIALLLGTGVLYLWGLGAEGWANAYYSAAVQAGTKSWKAFFFGSLDASNAITVDKSPGFLWPMVISARIFGVNAWSILVPQALEGVASVGLLYAAVRRWTGDAGALLAGAILALTPVAALMFRFNNPDALLVLFLTAGGYAMVRALEAGKTGWLVSAGALVGMAFLAKMLQALLVVPAFGLVYLIAAPVGLGRRIRQLLLSALAMLVSAGWWIAILVLIPASSRPYIGGSQNNSILNLMFGYNGFGRLTGDEAGSVGGGATNGAGRWGFTGFLRLFNSAFGGQISWLLPGALVLLVAVLGLSWRANRTSRDRAAMVLWGSWLLITGLAISLGQGIIHPYYTVALAPAIGAVIGIGSTMLWRRHDLAGRAALAVSIGVTAWWSWHLLGRTPAWHPGLRTGVLVGGVVAAIALLAGRWLGRGPSIAAASVALVATLAGPAAYTWATVSTTHAGAIPSAGPSGQGGFGIGGPGGGGGFPGGGPQPAQPGGGLAGGLPQPGQTRGGVAGGRPPLSQAGGGVPGGRPPLGQTGANGQDGRGGVGGILNSSKPSEQLVQVLSANASRYTWVAAAVSANQAAGYQLSTGQPVMAIGGFNGTDPSPTLGQFQQYVAEGKVHYFIGGGGGPGGAGGPGGGLGGDRGTGSSISSWVAAHFTAQTIGGATIYDLTAPSSTTTS